MTSKGLTVRDVLDSITKEGRIDLNYLTSEFFEGRIHVELYSNDEMIDHKPAIVSNLCDGEVTSEVMFRTVLKIPTHVKIFLDEILMTEYKIKSQVKKGQNLKFKWALGMPLDPSRR